MKSLILRKSLSYFSFTKSIQILLKSDVNLNCFVRAKVLCLSLPTSILLPPLLSSSPQYTSQSCVSFTRHFRAAATNTCATAVKGLPSGACLRYLLIPSKNNKRPAATTTVKMPKPTTQLTLSCSMIEKCNRSEDSDPYLTKCINFEACFCQVAVNYEMTKRNSIKRI